MAAVICIVAPLAACNPNDDLSGRRNILDPAAYPPGLEVAVFPSEVWLQVNQSKLLTAVVTDDLGREVETEVTWASSDPSVVACDLILFAHFEIASSAFDVRALSDLRL